MKAVDSGFYSPAAIAAGGRPATLAALDTLIRDFESVIADTEQRIADLKTLIADQEAGQFIGRPPSSVEATFVQGVCYDKLAHLQRLHLACKQNLRACEARLEELGI